MKLIEHAEYRVQRFKVQCDLGFRGLGFQGLWFRAVGVGGFRSSGVRSEGFRARGLGLEVSRTDYLTGYTLLFSS